MTFALPWVGLESVLLAGVRIAAFLVISPPFAHRGIPGTVKAMLAMGLALLVAPRARAASRSRLAVPAGISNQCVRQL